MSYIKKFNEIVDEFFCELIEIFPEEKRIKVEYSLFKVLQISNSKKCCNDFMLNCQPHLEKIYNKDITFFTGIDKPPFFNKFNIEKHIPTLSSTTKEAIWNYIYTFIGIGINIIPMPQESLIIINLILKK